MPFHVDVSETPLKVEDALAFCDADDHGATGLFVGRVRNINDGRTVQAVTYDVHDTLCRQVLGEICSEALLKWGDGLRLWLVHRRGRHEVGEASVIAAASSRHREDTFQACRYLVEQMKVRAPVWKQEHYVDADSEWLGGNSLARHD